MMYSCQVFNNPGAILELLIGPQRRVVLSGFEEPVMEWSCQGKVIKSRVIDLTGLVSALYCGYEKTL